MTPEIKHRIGQIRRGEMPEGYNRVRDSIIPSDWKQYCLGELGKNKNGLNFHREDKGIKIRILGVGNFGNLSVLRDLNAVRKYEEGTVYERMAVKPEDFLKFEIFLPQIEEQAAIAEVLSTADREIELLQQDIEQEKQKKKALMQLLLTGIVRVKT